ncbi:hypothetical protein PR048_009900 [Dryococelus australis]|uniref:Uncharacterized protein n=1 Tax=Dryococelus australis TaxID=614101 RepID=A0ABQ9I1M3_9NEOP|nr:hypothetical protein PR048_009900 [Dryococelus australis]
MQGEGNGRPRENPSTSGIVRHDSYVNRTGSDNQESNPFRLNSDRDDVSYYNGRGDICFRLLVNICVATRNRRAV